MTFCDVEIKALSFRDRDANLRNLKLQLLKTQQVVLNTLVLSVLIDIIGRIK